MDNRFKTKYFLSVLLSLLFLSTNAKSYKLKFLINNQRQKSVYLFILKGDNQTEVDTFNITDLSASQLAEINFILPKKSPPGMYRVILGQTRVAELMNEPPQHIDSYLTMKIFLLKPTLKRHRTV